MSAPIGGSLLSRNVLPCGLSVCEPETFSQGLMIIGDVHCPLKDINCRKMALCPNCHQPKPEISYIGSGNFLK